MTVAVFDRLAALAEPIRVRLLRVLLHEELAVGEVARVLQASQPTASRHLKQLEGWLLRRKVGTATFYRLEPDQLPDEARALWAVVMAGVEAEAEDPASVWAEDLRRLGGVVAARSADSAELFRRLGSRWDDVRAELFGTGFVAATLAALLPPGQRVADLGCGTGALLPVLAPAAAVAYGVDREAAMLEVAAARTADLANVELRVGLLDALPLDTGAIDIALCQLVLHHVRELGPVFAEVARVLGRDGRLVVVDMVEHEREEYRDTMGHQHLGFSEGTLRSLAESAGLRLWSYRPLPADPAAQGPSLFVGVFGR